MEKKDYPKDEIHELLQTLDPPAYYDGSPLVKYNDFWSPLQFLRRLLYTQRYFEAKDDDVILASVPKSGTTWLKALSFSIVNRTVYTIDQNPLLTCNPHALVPFLEHLQHEGNPGFISTPRIIATHIPFNNVPDSIRESKCRIIYICRNPLDQFISGRHFYQENKHVFRENKVEKDFELCEAFDLFCQGIYPYGPFWDHMLGYWNAHLKNPEKVLFLKYEDLKGDIALYIKKIAEFLGCPFSVEEEKQGLVEEIAEAMQL
ncbi:hypothetical protein DH2020_049376 [Rehmannia glutinosa]|uniref:Sulfotransferase n=1 Tax=Rehmannia glutinosa TaxID=99300 RepID=A0ABR0U305_REHGL